MPVSPTKTTFAGSHERYQEAFPGLEDYFPDPVARDASSWKAVGYLGFGGFGPLIWSSAFANIGMLHPEKYVVEDLAGESTRIYIHDFTDERLQFNIGNEMQLRLWPDRLDAVWSAFYGMSRDADNDIMPSDDRTA